MVVKVPVSVTMLPVLEFVQLVDVVVAPSSDAVWLDLLSLPVIVPEVATTLLEAALSEAVVSTEEDANVSVEAVDCTATELEPLPATTPLEISEAETVIETSDGCATVVVEVYVGELSLPDWETLEFPPILDVSLPILVGEIVPEAPDVTEGDPVNVDEREVSAVVVLPVDDTVEASVALELVEDGEVLSVVEVSVSELDTIEAVVEELGVKGPPVTGMLSVSMDVEESLVTVILDGAAGMPGEVLDDPRADESIVIVEAITVVFVLVTIAVSFPVTVDVPWPVEASAGDEAEEEVPLPVGGGTDESVVTCEDRAVEIVDAEMLGVD